MATRIGTRVLITISDKHNPHSPVTVVRGFVSSRARVEATCDDGHPLWHGAVLRFGRSGGVDIKFRAEPKTTMEKLGIKEFKHPVTCYYCRTSVVLATRVEPHKCFECILRNPTNSKANEVR